MNQTPNDETTHDVETPVESQLLNQRYKASGLTAADLATATGFSAGTVRIALTGLRYRDGKPKATAPADQTLARLAGVLGLTPEHLREVGRDRAAGLLAEGQYAALAAPDLDTKAAIAGRAALAHQILAVFSTEELRAELERRDRAEHDALNQEGIDDAAADLRGNQL